MSNTALACSMVAEFWGDCHPHSIQEFQEYLQQKNILTVQSTHISSALYTAQQKRGLERIGRGLYIAGENLAGNRTGGIRYVLQKTKEALSTPINMMEISTKEKELIPSVQRLYQECERLLDELESGGGGHEISK